jgi:hypothetical protein
MNLPPVPSLPKLTPIVACCAIFLMAAAYMLFLYASWQSYQKDRNDRHSAIDELLSRFPKKNDAQPSAE